MFLLYYHRLENTHIFNTHLLFNLNLNIVYNRFITLII